MSDDDLHIVTVPKGSDNGEEVLVAHYETTEGRTITFSGVERRRDLTDRSQEVYFEEATVTEGDGE